MMNLIKIGNDVEISNTLPITLFAGINVLESFSLAEEVADTIKTVANKYKINYVFKASFDKANRSSVHSFRGCGFDKGLQWLSDIKNKFNVPVITDVHEPYQVKDVACVADVLQLPAFLSRQTDLVIELAKTNKPINVKKAQFLSPQEMTSIVAKFKESGNENIILCERGTSFGYNNLVVDMLGFDIMKQTGCPVLFDVTHSLQLPGAGNEKAGGRRQQALQLAKAGISQGIAGLFLETHPDPDIAKCDGPCALPLSLVDDFVSQVVELDRVVKNQNKLIIN